MASSTQQSGSSDVKKVMISSTAHDLPEHRDLVKDACLRQGMFPVMMEHMAAVDANAIEESLAHRQRGRHLSRHLRIPLRLYPQRL